MDDFGSGYSSLNMLKSMPVDFIKIDRGFLNEVVTTERGKTVIRFSISLAREMSIKVIAEGVKPRNRPLSCFRPDAPMRRAISIRAPCPSRSLRRWPLGQNILPVAPSIKPLPKTGKRQRMMECLLRKHTSGGGLSP